MESLQQRIEELEELLGLNTIEPDEKVDFDVAPLKKRLQDLELGLVLQTPVEKLYKMRQIFLERPPLTMKDRLRSIHFSHDLMLKRLESIEDLQHTSDLVLNSSEFANATQLQLGLEKANKEVEESAEVVASMDSELHQFYEELLVCLTELRQKVDNVETIVKKAEDNKKTKLHGST